MIWAERRWYTFEKLGPAPSARWGHSIAALGTRIFLLGGKTAKTDQAEEEDTNSVCVLDAGTYSAVINDACVSY